MLGAVERMPPAGDATWNGFSRGAAPGPSLHVLHEHGRTLPATAERGPCRVVFEGSLFNRRELRRELEFADAAGTDADVVLGAYERWGEAALEKLRGVFALALWDAERETLLCARDPLGLHPLFYARVGDALLLSSSLTALVEHPSVPNEINRAALADHLCDRWPDLEETYFAAVRRVPPGHALRGKPARTELYRYWDPAPAALEWIRAEELEEFDELLEQAVERCLGPGTPAIFLSGGLDSVSVAAVAAAKRRREGMDAPRALSLVFEDPACNEEEVQRRVAGDLGLPHDLLTITDAVGRRGLVAAALDMTADSPAPLLDLWNPAYHALALEGRRRGCDVILTGSGGDEWLGFSLLYAVDLMRRLNVKGFASFWDGLRREHDLSAGDLIRNALWHYGTKPLLRAAAVRALFVAPRPVRAAVKRRRVAGRTPAWVAPDAGLMRQLYERHEHRVRRPHPAGFYVGEMRRALDNPLIALQLEELHTRGARLGMPLLHPFWDADLASFLYRTPPEFLMRGGRSKGLVRESLARTFPELGFDRHKKVTATSFFNSVVLREGRPAWERLGGPRALARLGVVDADGANAYANRVFAENLAAEASQIWYLLSLEAWLRTRIDP
jgi:asparagine synthase (glutamine-hydrolysing)